MQMDALPQIMTQTTVPAALAILGAMVVWKLKKSEYLVRRRPLNRALTFLMFVLLVIGCISLAANFHATMPGPAFIFPLIPVAAIVLIAPFMLLAKAFGGAPNSSQGGANHSQKARRP